MMIQKIILIFFCFSCMVGATNNDHVDLIIFSYNRPMQLYALLESIMLHVQGLDIITVIYRTSHDLYEYAYEQVQQTFASVIFCHQQNPPDDFKYLVINTLQNSKQKYILFAVDDMVVTGKIDLINSIQHLENNHAYGFYFRLGTHLTYCHSAQKKQDVPAYTKIGDDVFAWQFDQGMWDWAYPNTVDMTLYRTHEVISDVKNLPFKGPNSFEAYWALQAKYIMKRLGIFHQHAKAVNLPLNQVQLEGSTPHMLELTAENLLEQFLEGKKIDIEPLWNIENIAAHMEYVPTFVKR